MRSSKEKWDTYSLMPPIQSQEHAQVKKLKIMETQILIQLPLNDYLWLHKKTDWAHRQNSLKLPLIYIPHCQWEAMEDLARQKAKSFVHLSFHSDNVCRWEKNILGKHIRWHGGCINRRYNSLNEFHILVLSNKVFKA